MVFWTNVLVRRDEHILVFRGAEREALGRASPVVLADGPAVVRDVPGLHSSSQRAENWALASAIHQSTGAIRIGSASPGVVNTSQW